jgi:hypothetical protein
MKAYRLLTGIIFTASLWTIFGLIVFSNAKPTPRYKGVDPEIAPLVDEWIGLGGERGYSFKNTVTVGFMSIDSPKDKGYLIIGQCHLEDNFREIDFDKNYWDNSDFTEKEMTPFHELAHCYCDRKHDYGKNKDYDENKETYPKSTSNGFFEDECPLSLMYPVLFSKECFYRHYAEYIDEMFDRCEPY